MHKCKYKSLYTHIYICLCTNIQTSIPTPLRLLQIRHNNASIMCKIDLILSTLIQCMRLSFQGQTVVLIFFISCLPRLLWSLLTSEFIVLPVINLKMFLLDGFYSYLIAEFSFNCFMCNASMSLSSKLICNLLWGVWEGNSIWYFTFVVVYFSP